jgi:hypothetical protein
VIDQSGVVLTSAGGQKPAIMITPSATGFMPVPRSFDREKISPGARWICESTNVPTDFALIKEGFSYHCPPSARAHDNTNAWFIRKPTSSETMCKGFLIWRGVEMAGAPIPTGYVVTSEADSPVCGKSPDLRNAWIIQLPKGRMTVCKGFSIPRGFVVIGEKPSATCPAKPFEKNAWVIEPKWDRQ